MKGARNGLFFDISTIKKTNVFSRCTHRLWFRFVGQLALHVRFPNESDEPLWARNMRPLRLPDLVLWPRFLWSFAEFQGRPSLATPLLGFGAHGTRPHIHPAVQSEVSTGTRFVLAFMYSLSSAGTSELSSS